MFLRAQRAHCAYRRVESEAGVESEASVESDAVQSAQSRAEQSGAEQSRAEQSRARQSWVNAFTNAMLRAEVREIPVAEHTRS